MVMELLSYPTSIINPLLKVLAILLFGTAGYLFFRCQRQYGGVLRQVATLLCLGAIAGLLASAFRFQGDFYQQYKWGESVLNLVVVLIMLVIALVIRTRMNAAVRVFETGLEDDRP